MFRPQIQKTRVLIGLAVISLLMVYISSNSTVTDIALGYEYKLKSAQIMDEALRILKKEVVEEYGNQDIDDFDPNETRLIFFGENSAIKTGSGDLESKQTTLKSNFAALIIDEFIKAGIDEGDTIAVGMTGSMPGANLALFSACKAMNIYPIVISSMGSSMWGATDSAFTWIDMENILYEAEIFDKRSIAYSLGGKGDCLRPRSGNARDEKIKNQGRAIFEKKIKTFNASKIEYYFESGDSILSMNNLYKSIGQRIQLFNNNIDNVQNYSAYINIGGGAASIGVGGKDRLNTPGYLKPKKVLSQKPNESVTRYFAENNIPLIHILHIPQFVKGILPFGSEKTPVGESKIYKQEKYNLIINIIALLISLGSVVFIGIKSHNQIKKRMQSYEPESIL